MTEESEPEAESQSDAEDSDNDELQNEILGELESVHDPEIPVNIVDLGLIYDMEFDDGQVDIDMTLTSMGCPTADSIMREVELTAEQVDYLAALPTERTLFDGRLKVVHGHPENPDRYTYPGEFGPGLLGEESVLVMGHTHVQHVEETAAGVIANPGSVGQPRDRDPRAAYAVLDLDSLSVETHRVDYDIGRVERAVAEADLPLETATRLRDGR
ncbi:MAG: iron-sulfur cluster assembly protein [Halobacteriales archaeon]